MDKIKVIIVHGFEGKPNGGWRPWLMGELAKKDIWACSLGMPKANEPIASEWIEEIRHACVNAGAPNSDIYLVGHSLGVSAVLRYLETLPNGQKISGAILVSGPFENTKEEHGEKMKTFFDRPFDFEKIKNSSNKFFIIHGDNDPVVDFSAAERFSKELSGKLISVKNGGHLNGSSMWYQLPEALSAILGF